MTRRHVLRSDTEDRNFMPRFQALLPKLKEKTGFSFVFARTEDVSDDIEKQVWAETENRGSLSVLDDLESQSRWLEIEGKSEAFEQQVDDAILLLLEIVPLRQLRGQARNKPNPVTLNRMAWGAGATADAETMELLVASLASNNPERVRGAAQAAATLRWPELAPALEAAAAIKRTSRVKRALRAALEVCRPAP